MSFDFALTTCSLIIVWQASRYISKERRARERGAKERRRERDIKTKTERKRERKKDRMIILIEKVRKTQKKRRKVKVNNTEQYVILSFYTTALTIAPLSISHS